MLGLKVGIHPVIQNRSENMGAMSAKDLMQGPSTRGESDYVEYYLHKQLGPMTADESDDYYDDYDEIEENTTIVGTALHGPTFDETYDECSREVGSGISTPL